LIVITAIIKKNAINLVVCIGLISCHSVPTRQEISELEPLIRKHDVLLEDISLLIRRHSDQTQWFINKQRAYQQFRPASTTKIPHSLIGVETLAIQPNTLFKWNGIDYGSRNWNKTQTLEHAFRNSTVWVYQLLTTRVGHSKMQNWLQQFNYGNANIGSQSMLTRYWLDGPLQISSDEQVDFLEKVHQRKLGLQQETYQQTLPIMLNDSQTGRRLYAKTGLYPAPNGGYLGWFVGWLEIDNTQQTEIYTFALNIDVAEFSERKKRKTFVIDAFKKLNLWD